jgi:hypothetical protein
MATEGHKCGGNKIHQQQENTCDGKKNCHQPSKDEVDKELTEIRARMEILALHMQKNAESRWVYEWPMKTKVKWPVKELLAKRQQRLLKE